MNKKVKIMGLALSMFALAGCSYTVVPNTYDDSLVKYEDGTSASDITNNYYGIIYDKLVEDGTINTTVFNDLMYKIAQNVLPEYYGENGIFENKAAFDKEVDKLMNEKLYDLISNGSYLTDDKFDELKLITDLNKQNYKIVKATGDNVNPNRGTVVFTPETKSFALDEEKLGGTSEYDADNILHYDYSDYKEKYLKREVYGTLLVSKYLEDESYGNLGRAYARKVSYIAIEKDTKGYADYTTSTFFEKFIGNENVEYKSDDDAKTWSLNDLAKLWKGVDYSNSTHELSTKLQTIIDDNGLHTLADDIDENYYKVVDKNTGKPLEVTSANTSLVDDFTGSRTYTPEVGKEKKDVELAKKKFVTEGWYIKNGGLSSLPSKIRSRLFDVRCSQDYQAIKANNNNDDGLTLSGFLREINGVCYLLPETIQNQQDDTDLDVRLYDADSSTYYIVIVEDALNTQALNLTDATDAEKLNKLQNAHEVAKMLATKDANKTEATIYYLKNANIVFHDSDIYDYFKSTYADMFEED